MNAFRPLARLTEQAALHWNGLSSGKQMTAACAATAATGFIGSQAASSRDHISAQAIAYGSVFGVIGGLSSYAVGRAALRVAMRSATAELASGAIDDATHAARIVSAEKRVLRPGRVLTIGSAGVALGVINGNGAVDRAYAAMQRRGLESTAAIRPAAKRKG